MPDFRKDSRNALNQPGVDANVVEETVFGSSAASLDQLESGRIVAKPISINDIFPDAAQPRRQIPTLVRQQWNGEHVGELFGLWIMAVGHESNLRFEDVSTFIQKIIAGEQVLPAEAYHEETGKPIWKLHTTGNALMAVVELAAEIRRDGLTNPITVIRAGERFKIDTGERRWLAYQLLSLTYDGGEWATIPAREVKTGSVWRQASENTARRQLNAIGMARQLAILIMDLYRQQNHPEDLGEGLFLGYEYFSHDLDYYAQVADGVKWHVPRGKAQMVLNAMDLNDPTQLRQYRMLLRLPYEVWTTADDLGWTENYIRGLATASANGRALVERATMEAEKEGYSVTPVTVWDDDEGETTPESEPDSGSAPDQQGKLQTDAGSTPDQQEDEFQTDTQERYAANEAESNLGGRGAPVKMTTGQAGTLSHVTGGVVHVVTANGVRQYKLENVSRADVPAASARPTVTDPPPNPNPPLPTQIRMALGDPHVGGAATGTSTPQPPSPAEIDRQERVAMKPIKDALDQFKFSVERAKLSRLTQAPNRNQMGNLLKEARRVIDELEKGYLG